MGGMIRARAVLSPATALTVQVPQLIRMHGVLLGVCEAGAAPVRSVDDHLLAVGGGEHGDVPERTAADPARSGSSAALADVIVDPAVDAPATALLRRWPGARVCATRWGGRWNIALRGGGTLCAPAGAALGEVAAACSLLHMLLSRPPRGEHP